MGQLGLRRRRVVNQLASAAEFRQAVPHGRGTGTGLAAAGGGFTAATGNLAGRILVGATVFVLEGSDFM